MPSRENQLPRAVRLPPGSVAAAFAQLRSPARGWGREPGSCTRPGYGALSPPDWGSSHARLVRSGPERPARSCVSTPLDLWERHRPACRVRARLGLAWEPTAWTSPSAPLVRLHQQALSARPRCPHWWPTGVRGAGVARHSSQAKARVAGSAGRMFALRRCS